MNDLETRLRDGLHGIAADVDPSPGLWSRVAARHRTTQRARAAVAVAVSLGLVAVAVVALRPREAARPARPPVTSPPAGPVVATLDLKGVNAVTLDGNAVWLAQSSGHLVRADRATATVTGRYRVTTKGGPLDVVAAGGAIWTMSDAVLRVDPATGRVLSRTPVQSDNAHPLAAGPAALWAVCCDGRGLRSFDLRTGALLRSVALTQEVPYGGAAVGHGAVWVNAAGGLGAARVDLATGAVRSLTVPYRAGNAQGNVAVTDDAVWLELGDTLARLDPATGAVTATVELGEYATVFDMAAYGGTLWVAANQSNMLYRVDSATARITGQVSVNAPVSLAADATSVWVADRNGVERIDPARAEPFSG